ncbi:hypothetical protein AC629_05930 [Bradyrhizobium sp. NAS80.1]|nr:hypothetical protein AC629_05930 [Bradyrhizobium sp. NAS80.1]
MMGLHVPPPPSHELAVRWWFFFLPRQEKNSALCQPAHISFGTNRTIKPEDDRSGRQRMRVGESYSIPVIIAALSVIGLIVVRAR